MSNEHLPTAEADLDAVPAGDEEVGTSDEAPRKRRIGIGGKLIAAFSAVAAITLVACAVAWFSFDTAENAFTEITEGNLPSIVTAQQLAEASSTYTAGLPLLYASKTPEDLARQAETQIGRAHV